MRREIIHRKKTAQFLGIIAALLCLGGGAEVFSQRPQHVGGSEKTAVTGKEVKAAAKAAARREQRKNGGALTLVSIERAERQVVSGMNYKLCLKVKDGRKVKRVETVVYRDLRRKYSLASWREGNCRG